MMAFVAAEKALGQESLVAKVALEGQVTVFCVGLLENQHRELMMDHCLGPQFGGILV